MKINIIITRRRSMFSECQHRRSCFVGGPVVVLELSSRPRKSWLGSNGRSGRAGIDRCPIQHPVSDPCEREPAERGCLSRSGNVGRNRKSENDVLTKSVDVLKIIDSFLDGHYRRWYSSRQFIRTFWNHWYPDGIDGNQVMDQFSIKNFTFWKHRFRFCL